MEQMHLFDFMLPMVSIEKPIRLIELFSGVGAQAMALRNLGVEFEHYLTCEWDINAIAMYHAIHMPDDDTDYSKDMTDEELITCLASKGISSDGKNPLTEEQIRRHPNGEVWRRKIYNDITATHDAVNVCSISGGVLNIVDCDRYTYILTYSYPCTSVSLAGKREGMIEGSGTASSLLWEVRRLLDETENLPQILLMENVAQVLGEQNIDEFKRWQRFLEDKGYTNFTDILNAKDFGVAQNRERCFMVSILGNYNYKMPITMPLKYILDDYLDDIVPQKYYNDSDAAKQLIVDLEERGELEKVSRNIRGVQQRKPSAQGIWH